MADQTNPADASQRTPRFRRAPEEERRTQLIEATLQVIAEEGLMGVTVRNIASRTEVTAGLIRHYFAGKDELVQEAYRVLVTRMVAHSREAITGETEPRLRLRAFIAVQFSKPMLDAGFMRQWAIFISLVHLDPRMAAIHDAGFSQFRNEVEALIAEVLAAAGKPRSEAEVHRLAFAVSGVIDGLWLEGCLHMASGDPTDFEDIAVETIGQLLGASIGDPHAAPSFTPNTQNE